MGFDNTIGEVLIWVENGSWSQVKAKFWPVDTLIVVTGLPTMYTCVTLPCY